jgi:predicted dehydrogenase
MPVRRNIGRRYAQAYDPFVRDMMSQAREKYGCINRVRACLEEPIDVSTEIFQWAERSNPFTYVGCHWLDVVAFYLDAFPASLHAVGQKQLLKNWERYHRIVAEKENCPLGKFSTRELTLGRRFSSESYPGTGVFGNSTTTDQPSDFEGASIRRSRSTACWTGNRRSAGSRYRETLTGEDPTATPLSAGASKTGTATRKYSVMARRRLWRASWRLRERNSSAKNHPPWREPIPMWIRNAASP